MAGSVKVKTQDLSGSALDWAVGSVEGNGDITPRLLVLHYKPSTDWSVGGPLIDKYRVELTHDGETRSRASGFCGYIPCEMSYAVDGDTALIAACRAIVAARIGDEVDVPEGLV